MIYRGDNILRGFDDDVRTHVRAEMEKRGITILTGCTVDKVDKHGKEFTTHLSNGSSIASDQVMFAIGRHPNVANLGLEKAGVAINPKNGGIAVDDWSQDLGAAHLCHRRRHPSRQPDAGRDPRGPRLRRHRVRQARRSRSITRNIPTAVFSQPEVGTVGLTEAEARAQFSHVDIYKADFRPIKATMSGRDTRVLMKLVVDGTTDRVLGCHIVGDAAAEIIQAVGDRGEDEGDQGRFRRHHGAASDRGGRAGDHAHADRAPRAAGGGVGKRGFSVRLSRFPPPCQLPLPSDLRQRC